MIAKLISSLIVTPVVAIAIFCLYKILQITLRQFTYRHRMLSRIPTPPTVPVLGHVEFLRAEPPMGPFKVMRKFSEQYGSPFCTNIFGSVDVELFKPHQMEIILKSNVNITKSNAYDFLEPWLGKGLLMSTGSKWFRRRKQLTPTFHFSILCDFVPIINEAAAVLLDILGEKTGNTVDVCGAMSKCTLDIICETAMGTKLDSQRKQSSYVDAIARFGDIFVKRHIKPWLWYDFMMYITPIGWEHNATLKILHQFTNKVIQERLQYRRSASETSDKKRLAFLDSVLDLHEKGEMTLREVREEVDTFMFEGHDTTATAMMWNLFCAARYPDIQQRIHAELDDHFGSSVHGDISAEDVSKLRYMEMFIKEVQRLYPSVPTIARVTSEDVRIDDYLLPAGTNVKMHIFEMQRDPEVFPNPERFDPMRFTGQQRNPFAFTPFSAGPRNCIGQKFAMLEEKILLAHILRRFSLSTTQTEDDAMPTPMLVLRPFGGVRVMIKERH